jgi:hypothetical protein
MLAVVCISRVDADATLLHLWSDGFEPLSLKGECVGTAVRGRASFLPA